MYDTTQAEHVSFIQKFTAVRGSPACVPAARKLIEFTHQVLDMLYHDAVDLAEFTLEHMADLPDTQKHMLAREIKQLEDSTIRMKAVYQSFGWEPVLTWRGELQENSAESSASPSEAASDAVIVAFPLTDTMRARLG